MIEKDKAILAEVTDAIAEVKNDSGKSERNFLPERPDEFPTTAMSFCHINAMIMEQTEELFAVTRCADRFSPQYLKLCKTLEKTVNHLGSSFITKEAMSHKSYYDVSEIESLSAQHLYEMICFNFRKCDAALNQIKLDRHEFDLDYFHQMLSFAKIMERLSAAEHRAYEYDHGFTDTYERTKSVLSFTDKDGNPNPDKRNKKGISFRNTPSFPIRYDVLGAAEMPDHQKTEISGEDHADPEIIEGKIIEAPVSDASDSSKVEPVNRTPEVSEEIPDAESAAKADEIQNSDAYENLQPEIDVIVPKQEPGRPSLYTEPPAYLEVIMCAMKRSAGSEEDSICFTEEEMRQLLADPEFCRLEKDLAQAFRGYFDRMDSG